MKQTNVVIIVIVVILASVGAVYGYMRTQAPHEEMVEEHSGTMENTEHTSTTTMMNDDRMSSSTDGMMPAPESAMMKDSAQ